MKYNALKKLYDELDFEDSDIIEDVNIGILTKNVTRRGRMVLWYYDGENEKAIYTDSLEFLTADEIEKELY